jgi:hypothetical protein
MAPEPDCARRSEWRRAIEQKSGDDAGLTTAPPPSPCWHRATTVAPVVSAPAASAVLEPEMRLVRCNLSYRPGTLEAGEATCHGRLMEFYGYPTDWVGHELAAHRLAVMHGSGLLLHGLCTLPTPVRLWPRAQAEIRERNARTALHALLLFFQPKPCLGWTGDGESV